MSLFIKNKIISIPATRTIKVEAGVVIQHEKNPTDFLFYTNLKLVSLLDAFSYTVYDKTNTLITNGTSTGTDYFNKVAAFTTTDPISVYFLKYGYVLKSSGFVLTPVETLMYMEHVVNPFIVADIITAEAYADTGVSDKIIVDAVNKTLTVNVSINSQMLYDYLQWWQSRPVNADSLLEGIIYNTIDGTNFLLKSTWSRLDTGGPVYVAIDGNGVDHTGDLVVGYEPAVYSATFLDVQTAFADATYGNRDLVTPNISQYYHVYRYELAYSMNDYSMYVETNTSPTNKFYLSNAPEEAHKGVINDAVKVHFKAGYNARAIIRIKGYIEVSGIAFTKLVPRTGYAIPIIEVYQSATFHSNIVTATDSTSTIGILTKNDRFSTFESYITNNIVYGLDVGIFALGYTRGNILNNLTTGNITGLRLTYPYYYSTLANNFSVSNSGLDYDNTAAASSTLGVTFFNNASGDGTNITDEAYYSPAFGMANDGTPLTDLVATNEFQDFAGQNFHLSGSSRLIGTGFDPSTYGVLADFEGDTRVAPHSIGVDHPLSFNVPVVITVIDVKTQQPVQGAALFAKADANGVITQGTTMFTDITNVQGQFTYQYLYTGSDQGIVGRARKGSTAPFYKTSIFSGTVTATGLSITVYVNEET